MRESYTPGRDIHLGWDRRMRPIVIHCVGWAPLYHRMTTDGREVQLAEFEQPYRSWRDWWACEVLGLSKADARRLTYWEADHIVPVAEGGWYLGLENLQTKCIWCHRQKTGDDIRRMRMAGAARV